MITICHHGEFFPGTTIIIDSNDFESPAVTPGTEAPSHAWSEIELPRSQCAWTIWRSGDLAIYVTIGFSV
jgi:hypothetical protein